jgi:poly(hydroxyalkanoate) granule-associated protein
MVKKLKQLTSNEKDGQLVAAVKGSANQIWLAGLGAFAKAQEEGTKFFDTLVREGEKVQQRTAKAAGDKIADVRGQATGAWDKLERVFEERVGLALHGLNVPTRKDVDSLAKRVGELTAVTKKLAASMGTAPAQKPPRRATKQL